MVYFNYRSSQGVETVDQLERKDFENLKEYRKEVARLVSEYRLTGMNVYTSTRCTKEWKNL